MIIPNLYRNPKHAERNVLFREGYRDAAYGKLDEYGKFCTPYTDALNQEYKTVVARCCTKLEGKAALLDGSLAEAKAGYERIMGRLESGTKAALPEGGSSSGSGYQDAFRARQERAKQEADAEQMTARACAARKQAREAGVQTALSLVELREHAANWLEPYRAGVYAANPDFAGRLAPFGDGDLFKDDASKRLDDATDAHGELFGNKPPVLPFGCSGGAAKQLESTPEPMPMFETKTAKEALHV